MRIYLAGPMTGYPDWNRAAFAEKTAELRAQGHTVFSPAEVDINPAPGGFLSDDLRKAFYQDMRFICLEADKIVLLPGWEKSMGARAEHATAVVLGLDIEYP